MISDYQGSVADEKVKRLLRAIDRMNLEDEDILNLKKLIKKKLFSEIIRINKQRLEDNSNGSNEANITLIFAGQSGSITLFLKSLVHGANPNAKDDENKTVLHSAAHYNQIHLIRFFFETGEFFELFKQILYSLDNEKRTLFGSSFASIYGTDVRSYLMGMGFNPFIGEVYDLDEYKQKWLYTLENSTTIKELKANLKKQGINPKEELLELSLKHPDMIQIFAENCSSLLFDVLKS